jgi:hypothetical protein
VREEPRQRYERGEHPRWKSASRRITLFEVYNEVENPGINRHHQASNHLQQTTNLQPISNIKPLSSFSVSTLQPSPCAHQSSTAPSPSRPPPSPPPSQAPTAPTPSSPAASRPVSRPATAPTSLSPSSQSLSLPDR